MDWFATTCGKFFGDVRRLRNGLRNQRGFSLIELLVAMSIFMVLLVASTTLYSGVLKVNLKDKANQDLQREGDAILSHMSRTLKEAVAVDTANSNFVTNPNVLQVKLVNPAQTRKYYVTGNQLHYVDESGTDTDLLSPGSTDISLTFTPTSDAAGSLVSIRINATLQRIRYGQTVTLPVGSTITTRPQ